LNHEEKRFEKQALLCKHDHRQRTRLWRSGVSDNIQQKIEFIIEQQATFAVDIARMKEVQRQQAASIDRLTENMHQTREMLHDVIGEMREGFNNLIVANEVTRKLAEDVGPACHSYEPTGHSAGIKARK
jgi:hypothetical protein